MVDLAKLKSSGHCDLVLDLVKGRSLHNKTDLCLLTAFSRCRKIRAIAGEKTISRRELEHQRSHAIPYLRLGGCFWLKAHERFIQHELWLQDLGGTTASKYTFMSIFITRELTSGFHFILMIVCSTCGWAYRRSLALPQTELSNTFFFVFSPFVFPPLNRILKFLASLKESILSFSILVPRLLRAVSGKQYILLQLSKSRQIGIT